MWYLSPLFLLDIVILSILISMIFLVTIMALSELKKCKYLLIFIFRRYSKGFGIIPKESTLEVPNCIYGILFYCLMIFLGEFAGNELIDVESFFIIKREPNFLSRFF